MVTLPLLVFLTIIVTFSTIFNKHGFILHFSCCKAKLHTVHAYMDQRCHSSVCTHASCAQRGRVVHIACAGFIFIIELGLCFPLSSVHNWILVFACQVAHIKTLHFHCPTLHYIPIEISSICYMRAVIHLMGFCSSSP